MNKKTKIILIIVATAIVLLGVLGYFLLKPKPTVEPVGTGGANPFPYGEPQLTQTSPLGTGSGTADGTQTPDGTETVDGGVQTGGSTGSNGGSGLAGGTQSGGTQSDTGTSSSTGSSGSTPTAPGTTPTTPGLAGGIPAAPTPGAATANIPAATPASSLDANRPTSQVNCYSPAGNLCFNKLEAAMYFAEKEIAEIDKVITIFRGSSTTTSLNDKLMDLDHCIPGPDYGFSTRAHSYLEANKEWQDIVGDVITDQYLKNGVLLELTDAINNLQLESNVKAKNIPMAQAGLAFVNATPKYNDIAREYRDRKTERSRSLSNLENLYDDWNLAKQTNDEALKQQVTIKFSQLNESLPTYDSYIEALSSYDKLTDDVNAIIALTATCKQQRVALATSFTQYQTFMGSSIKQSILDIDYVDNQKKLFCSIDPAHVNQLEPGISCRTTGGLGGNGDPQLRVDRTGADWDDCNALDNPDTEYNTDNDYAHPNVLQYITNPFTNQSAVRFGYGPRTTLRNLLHQYNPEQIINQVIDYTGGSDAGTGQVQIDDGGLLYAHSLYSFGITCENTYTSSRYDYIDELTLYGF